MDLRQPSFYERYQLCRTKNRIYSNFNVTIEYPNFSKNQLSQALKIIIENHPILTCNFFKTATNTDDDEINEFKNYTIRPFELKFDDCVEYNNYQIDENYFKYLNSIYFNIDKFQPLWKIIIPNDKYVTLVCNHTFLDGNSGIAFHNELLSILNTISPKCEFLEAVSNPNGIKSLPDTIDSVSDLYTPSLFFKLFEIGKHFLGTKSTTFKNVPISIGQSVNYRTLSFTNEEMGIILSKSKSVKFTSYFLQCAIECFRHYYNNDSVSVAIPLNGRRYDDTLDNFQLCTAASNVVVPTNVKNVGEYISKQLSEDLKTRNPFYFVGLLKSINITKLLKSKIGSYDRSTMEVSNIGKMKVANAWFSQDNGFLSHLQFNIMSSNSGLNITLGTFDELEDIMDEYVEKLKQTLIG